MPLESQRERENASSLTEELVDRIAAHRGVAPDDPDFCLYDDTDPEALEYLLARTSGPITTTFDVGDARVLVEKGSDGDVTVDVDSTKDVHSSMSDHARIADE